MDGTQTHEQLGLEKLRSSISESVRAHRTFTDGCLYNGGTVVVLFLTAGVSVLTGKVIDLGGYSWLPTVLSAVAGIFVALERSLGFGPRWRFHTEMKAGYKTVSDMIDYYYVVPQDEKEQRAKIRVEIWQSLSALRSRESAIPNSGGAVTAGS